MLNGETMFDFIFILLFGKTVLLTNIPVNIHENFSMTLKDPISAITTGASIQIDVSSMIKYEKNSNIVNFRKDIEEMFPPQSVTATLISDGGQKVVLQYDGKNMFNEEHIFISLYSDNGFPKGEEYSRIEVSSATELRAVKLFWKNYKK